MLALQFQLEHTQYAPGDWLRDQQLRQAATLAYYAVQAVPFYAGRTRRR